MGYSVRKKSKYIYTFSGISRQEASVAESASPMHHRYDYKYNYFNTINFVI